MSQPLTGIQASSQKYYNRNRAYLLDKARLNYQQHRDKKVEYAKLHRIKLKTEKRIKEMEEITLRKLTLVF
jgi:hypothetical protein